MKNQFKKVFVPIFAGLVLGGLIAAYFSGCGGASNQDKAGSVFAAFSGGGLALSAASSQTGLRAEDLMGAKEALRNPIDDLIHKMLAIPAGKTDAQADLGGQSSRRYTCGTGSYSFTTSTVSCSISCPSSTYTVSCTLTSPLTASWCGTTYTYAKGGTFSITLPVGSTGTNYSLNFGINMTVSGGSFGSSGETVDCSFGINPSKGFPTNSSTCSTLQNYSCTVNGSSVACTDLMNGYDACSNPSATPSMNIGSATPSISPSP